MGENITSESEHELPDTPKEELSEFLKFDIDQKEQAYNTRNHIQAEGSLGVRGCWPSASGGRLFLKGPRSQIWGEDLKF